MVPQTNFGVPEPIKGNFARNQKEEKDPNA